jgi:hypothetical protein
MSLTIDAVLSFGSLGLTILTAICLRVGFRHGRDYRDV